MHFSKRWQLLNHKLDRFATEMYLNNFGAAFYFIRTGVPRHANYRVAGKSCPLDWRCPAPLA